MFQHFHNHVILVHILIVHNVLLVLINALHVFLLLYALHVLTSLISQLLRTDYLAVNAHHFWQDVLNAFHRLVVLSVNQDFPSTGRYASKIKMVVKYLSINAYHIKQMSMAIALLQSLFVSLTISMEYVVIAKTHIN